MTNIEFSDEEMNALIGLLDVAVRAQGLNVAQNALVLATKIKQAARGIDNTPITQEVNPEFAEPLEAVEAV
tara:strand:+ start:1727 stop:1939 length:213 start_codon:yes stop_codon:yes gene_type:complete